MIIDAEGKVHFFLEDDRAVHSLNNIDTGVMYKSRIGIKFWFDINSRSFRTENDDVFIYMHSDMWLGGIKNAFIMHMNGCSISFSNSKGHFFDRSNSFIDENGDNYWRIGTVGSQLNYHDHTKARSVITLTNTM